MYSDCINMFSDCINMFSDCINMFSAGINIYSAGINMYCASYKHFQRSSTFQFTMSSCVTDFQCDTVSAGICIATLDLYIQTQGLLSAPQSNDLINNFCG